MTLSPEELAVVQALAEPIAFGQRDAFISAVTQAMMNASTRGPGAVHRIAAALQVTFIRTSVSITDADRHAVEALTRKKRLADCPPGVKDHGKVRWN
jgi:hypothetical protein